MKKMTNQDYNQYVTDKMPKSPILKDCLFAFVIGGLICVIGQLILQFWKRMGMGQEHAATCTSMAMVFIGALLTGLNIYPKIAKYAGAGTIVPITGFANSIVSPAMEFKSEGYVLGLGAKMFVIAGPVLVYGITASIFCGLIMALVKGVALW